MLALGATLGVTACQSGPASGSLTVAGHGSTAPTNPAGVVGYLHVELASVTYLQWQVDSAGGLQGTEDAAAIEGSPPNESISLTNNESFSGQVNGETVTLDINFHTDTGTVSSQGLTLNVIQTDGSIAPISYRPASPADYNQALASLRMTAQQANQQGQQQQDQADAIASLARASANLDQDASGLTEDVSSLADDVTSTGNDLASEKSDEQTVLSEAANGTDHDTVCGDADSVGGDADSMYGDQDSFRGDLDLLTNDLATVRDDMKTLAANLATVQRLQPSYTGTSSAPSRDKVNQAISSAQRLITKQIGVANGDIDKINNYIATAHKYAVAASNAGNCSAPSPRPTPVSHLK